MNQRRALWHKVGYACAIVALLLPLSYLSQPQTEKTKGGKLAQLRTKYQLSQADLGDIDPTSETIKLCTLGMRGIAANLMWQKANKFQKTEDWTAFSAAVEQIIRLQPNFIAVWRFQAHNISYNTSVQFDDYRDRYYWVMKGCNFLISGTKFNKNEPRLLYDIGWFIGQKIGRADEHKQYRKLFKEDDDFHNMLAGMGIGSGKLADRDNWLVGRDWFLKAQNVVDTLGIPVKGTSPVVFHSYPSMSLFNYAEAIEDEGTYGEVAKNAWRKGREAWREFGDRDLTASDNLVIHLNDGERQQQRSKEAIAELEKLVPGGREKIRDEKLAALPKDDRDLLDTPPDKRSKDENLRASSLLAQIDPTYAEIAARADTAHRLEALRLADTISQADESFRMIDVYRGIVNFDFWRLRGDMEQTGDALAARKLLYEGDEARKASDLATAIKKYEEGLAKWRAVIDAFPGLKRESVLVDDLAEVVDQYRKILGDVDAKFPQKFILQDILDVKQSGVYNPPPSTEGTSSDPSQSVPAKKQK